MNELMLETDSPNDWIAALAPFQARTILQMQAAGTGLEEIAKNWLSKVGADNTFLFGGEKHSEGLFNRVMDEMRKLICGDDSYSQLRNKIKSKMKEHKTIVIGTIAAAIGHLIGLSAVVLVPVVALIMSIVSEIGLNVWCSNGSLGST